MDTFGQMVNISKLPGPLKKDVWNYLQENEPGYVSLIKNRNIQSILEDFEASLSIPLDALSDDLKAQVTGHRPQREEAPGMSRSA